jgi:hypothetical protein
MTTPSVTAAPVEALNLPVPAVLPIDEPSGLETCDYGGCPANALWRVVFAKGELVFCGSHGVKAGYVQRATSHVVYENENKSKGSDH